MQTSTVGGSRRRVRSAATSCAFLALATWGLPAPAALARQSGSAAPADPTLASSALASPTRLEAAARIERVTLYPDAAQVVREAPLPEGQGTFELRFGGLPEVEEDALSARADGARVLDVRFEERLLDRDAATSEELQAAVAALDAARRDAARLALEGAALDDASKLLDAIAARAAAEGGRELGSRALEPEALARQVEFIATRRSALIDRRMELSDRLRSSGAEVTALEAKVKALGGRSRVERTAIVTVGKAQPGPAKVSLATIVGGGASWSPRYAIRAIDVGDDAADRLVVEFDAVVQQSTGEDWSDVALTLSTADPSMRPMPSTILPVYLSVPEPTPAAGEGGMVADKSAADARPGAPGGGGGGRGGFAGGGGYGGTTGGGIIGDAGISPERLGVALETAYADGGSDDGAVASYPIRRRISIPSDASTTRGVRIATIELVPDFDYVARPLVDPGVYLRASARNTSDYRLLEGEARLFIGDDSVGVVDLPTIPAGVEATFWFGADDRLECRRALVADEVREEGLLGKSVVRVSKWRVELRSSLPHACEVELDDRIPVSRDERVKVELRDLSRPLSTDADYVSWERPDGILRWEIPLRAAADGKPVAEIVTWTTRRASPVGVGVLESEFDPTR